MLNNQPLREAGPYAIETYIRLTHNDRLLPSRFEPAVVTTVYADNHLPSHSVRIFTHPEA